MDTLTIRAIRCARTLGTPCRICQGCGAEYQLTPLAHRQHVNSHAHYIGTRHKWATPEDRRADALDLDPFGRQNRQGARRASV